MRFRVEPPNLASKMIESGPQFPCWQGDELCAFSMEGPCTAIPCTCETTGVCMSCRPRDFQSKRGRFTR